MPYQTALTIAAPVRGGAEEGLNRLLATMGDGVANSSILDLSRLSDVHVVRLVVVPAETDVHGRPLPASLLYVGDADRPKADHLRALVEIGGAGIDRLFGHCEGYPEDTPSDEQRLAYLSDHVIDEAPTYVNTRRPNRPPDHPGGGAPREAVGRFLDRRHAEFDGKSRAWCTRRCAGWSRTV